MKYFYMAGVAICLILLLIALLGVATGMPTLVAGTLFAVAVFGGFILSGYVEES